MSRRRGMLARGMRGVALILVSVAAYLAVDVALERVLGVEPVAAGVVAAALVVLPLPWIRRGLERGVDLLVYGPDGDPARVLGRLGERVGEFDSGAEGLAGLAEALREALEVAAVEIVPADPAAPAVHVGERAVADATVVVELRAGGALLGELRVHPLPGSPLARGTVRRVEELAGIVATALRLALASARLGAARDALVAARQQERRTLRRELHDGIGPSLAGVGFGLAAVENLRLGDPAAASALAERLAGDLREQLGEVRRVARTVRVERVDLPLGTELAELAADFAGAGPVVRLDAPASALVPARATRPLALVAAEAVHNAVRHAHAAEVAIRLVHDDDAVVLTIRDDGRGFDPADVAAGVGLATMREHAAEAGAELALRSGPTGTEIVVRVPLPADPAASPTSTSPTLETIA